MDANKEDTGRCLHIGKERVAVHTREHYPYGTKCSSVITKSTSFFKQLSAVYCFLLIPMYSHAYHLLIEMDYCSGNPFDISIRHAYQVSVIGAKVRKKTRPNHLIFRFHKRRSQTC